jgi:hypothetical protein
MQIAGTKICPACGHADLATAILCNYCGKELHPYQYKMVCDGRNFGISLNGEVIFNALPLAKAQEIVTILNGS